MRILHLYLGSANRGACSVSGWVGVFIYIIQKTHSLNYTLMEKKYSRLFIKKKKKTLNTKLFEY